MRTEACRAPLWALRPRRLLRDAGFRWALGRGEDRRDAAGSETEVRRDAATHRDAWGSRRVGFVPATPPDASPAERRGDSGRWAGRDVPKDSVAGYCRSAARSPFLPEVPEILVSPELPRRRPAAVCRARAGSDRERFHQPELPGAWAQRAAERRALPAASPPMVQERRAQRESLDERTQGMPLAAAERRPEDVPREQPAEALLPEARRLEQRPRAWLRRAAQQDSAAQDAVERRAPVQQGARLAQPKKEQKAWQRPSAGEPVSAWAPISPLPPQLPCQRAP